MLSLLTPNRHCSRLFLSIALVALVFTLPASADEKGEAATDGASASDGDSTPRPQTPPSPPNPEELNLRPDDEGKVRFSFQGQPWLGVLEWLAQTSQLSLDWQEVPAGYLNLRTQQSYSVEEARDLINRHLLDRGFTLLKHGEILSVVKVRSLDPSLVPRLEPEELLEARPHDFVRVSFPLEWMTAEAAIDDLKPLISPNGKLTAIKSTNRLEAIDAVANLRDIQKMLSDPQSPRGPRRMVREFRLEHVKATDVQGHLQKLLGLEKASPASGDPTAIMQQMAKIMKEAGVAPQAGQQKQQQGPQVHLVANVRDNSILAHAPADQMAIIAEAIEVMDHPSDKTRSVLRNSQRVQVYPLAVADPEAVLKMLQDLADLSPDTRLQVDRKNRAIVAHANLADHLTIRMLVDKLDGTVRKFRVIPLSRLDADFVAGSIDLVMGGGESSKRPAGKDIEDEARRFRVVADVEKNRLLLWVNDDEFADVERLLAELGDAPGAPDRDAATVRVIETPDPAQAEELIRKLEQAWPAHSPNVLELGPGIKTEKAERPARRPDARSLRNTPTTTPPLATPVERDRRTGRVDCEPEDDAEKIRLVRLTNTPEEPVNGAPLAAEPAPEPNVLASVSESRPESPELPDHQGPAVRLERDAEGRLIAASQDPEAVDLVQKLMKELGPRAKGFRVFGMKHKTTWASSIAQNLQTFFEERQKAEEKRRTELATTARWYDPNGGKWINSPRAEAERKKQVPTPPKFIVDSDTNSILAVGASDEQLKAIEELIEVYDTAEAQEPHPTRVTRLVPVKYGQVKQIAETVKDVYRDLISTDSSSSTQRRRWFDPTYTVAYTGKGGETLVKYRGQLSVSSDDTSSSVVISAPEGLIDSVESTIKALDEASLASRPRVQVVKINRGVDPNEVQRKLMQAINRR